MNIGYFRAKKKQHDSQNSTTLINVFSNVIKKYHLHISLKLAFLDKFKGQLLDFTQDFTTKIDIKE